MGLTRRRITLIENFEDSCWIATAENNGLCFRHTDPEKAVAALLYILKERGDWPDAKDYYARTSGT